MFLTTYTVSLYRNEELQSDGQMCEAFGSYTLLKVKHTEINTLDNNYYYSTWTQKSRWLNTSKVYFLLTFHVYCGSVGWGVVSTVGIQASAHLEYVISEGAAAQGERGEGYTLALKSPRLQMTHVTSAHVHHVLLPYLCGSPSKAGEHMEYLARTSLLCCD